MTEHQSASASTHDSETLGQRLRRLMKEKGFNQTSLAKKSGVDRSDLNRIVNDRRAPRPEELAFLAQTLDVPLDELVRGVVLTDEQRKAVHFFEESAHRVLAAEAERDEAKARLRAAEEDHARAHERWQKDRGELLALVDRAREDAGREAEAARQAFTASEHARHADRLAASDEVSQLKAAINRLIASDLAHRQQNAALHAELVRERSNKYAAGFLGGLAGLVGGAVLGSSDNS